MPAGRGDLQAGDQRVVAADVREVGLLGGASTGRSGGGGGSASPAQRRDRAPCSDSTPTTSMSGTSAASRARESGSTIASELVRAATPSATASAPRTGRTSPVSDSSPTTAHALDRLGLQLTGRDEQRHRERQIERRPTC